MAQLSVQRIIGILIVLIVMSIILPIGIVYVSNFEWTNVTLANGTTVRVRDVVDPTIITLFSVLVPIMVVIGLIMYFIPKSRG